MGHGSINIYLNISQCEVLTILQTICLPIQKEGQTEKIQEEVWQVWYFSQVRGATPSVWSFGRIFLALLLLTAILW